MIKRTLFFSNPAHLSLRQGQLVIKLTSRDSAESDKEMTRPIEDIGVMIVESSQITLTSALISKLLEENVALVTCNSNHLPTGLHLNLSGNTLQSERFAAQISASLPLKKQLWQQTIKAKIANQASILRHHTSAETGCMSAWSEAVKSGDSDNLEGRAAAYYWKNLFDKDLKFKRDRDGLPPNHLLNYGYIVLRAIVARSLVGSGLLPTLGIHHKNRYNEFCLADDIMEPYRPYVDQLVLDIADKYGVDTPLSTEVKKELLSIPVLDVKIDGRSSPLMVATSQTSASLARCYLGLQRKISYPSIE